MELTRDTCVTLLLFILFTTYVRWKFNVYLSTGKNIMLNLKKKKKIGVLTNELPPIIYGGVSTWVLNFMDMWRDDDEYEAIPIFLAYLDKAPEDFPEKYPGIRIINCEDDIKNVFSDIDICINNIWISHDTIRQIKEEFPDMELISVCHSLIKMEHITNLGSQYTNNFGEQETVFKYSDKVICISKAEEKYFKQFGYDKFDTQVCVIYNAYKPKFDNPDQYVFKNYDKNHLGYIGRHVPRKRPELAIETVKKMGNKEIKVINMGVDFERGGNEYWKELSAKYNDQLEIIEFTCDKKVKERYFNSIAANVCSFSYEPFGYTVLECLDRRIPLIVGNLDGPKEITESVKDFVYLYDVDKDSMDNDIKSLEKTLKKFYELTPEERKENSEKARKALDNFRPEKIKKDWMKLFSCCKNVKVKSTEDKKND